MRASLSIPLNIAEGYVRSPKSFLYHLDIAAGSSNEVITTLKIVHMLYQEDTYTLIEDYTYLGKQLTLLRKFRRKKIEENS